jgi:septum formation topological specificity factor MinE
MYKDYCELVGLAQGSHISTKYIEINNSGINLHIERYNALRTSYEIMDIWIYHTHI